MRRDSGGRMRALALAALFVGLMAASPAQGVVDKLPTFMTLDPLPPVVWGARAVVTARLWLQDGTPVGDRHVDLTIAGAVSGGRTDAHGAAAFDIRPPINPDAYQIVATFGGSTDLLPSVGYGVLTVSPRLFTIHTVPATPGLPFNLGGTEFVSDADGIARIQVSPTFDDTITRPKVGKLVIAPGVEQRFARWRTHNGDLFATYEMFYDITLQFVDLAGNPVDPARIEKVDLKGAIGNQLTVQPNVPFTVLGQRVVPLAGDLQAKDVGYSVEDVVVDGASVVHRAQQRFTPSLQRVWTITLLFYAAHISVRDAIFGFPLDSQLAITYPDGNKSSVLAKGGELNLTGMARGTYTVVAQGWGIAFPRPVALSRNQEVELKFISLLDLGVAAGIGLVFVFGLIFVGRPGVMRALQANVRRQAPRAAAGAAVLTTRLAGAAASGQRLVRTVATGIYPPASPTVLEPAPTPATSATSTPPTPGPTPTPRASRPRKTSSAPRPAPVPAGKPRIRRMYVVRRGDTLRSIAGHLLGDENRWQDILRANDDLSLNAEKLPAGLRLKIP